jgi:hypothetical protein
METTLNRKERVSAAILISKEFEYITKALKIPKHVSKFVVSWMLLKILYFFDCLAGSLLLILLECMFACKVKRKYTKSKLTERIKKLS